MANRSRNDEAGLPLVAGPGRQTTVCPDLTSIHVVLQAGGKGERIRNGGTLPKPLFALNGMPMIERLVRQLAQAGARTVTVITGFEGDQVERAVRAIDGLPADLSFTFIRETAPRGNAGSLAVARRDLPCLFCFADLVTDIDFVRLVAVHVERQAAVTLASHYEPLPVRLGELTTDGDLVLAYREKPIHRVLIASGIAVFEPSVLESIPKDRPAGLSDVVQAAINSERRVTHWVHGARWIDVNTPEDLAAARQIVDGAPVAQ